MKNLSVTVSSELYDRIREASAVLGKSTDATVEEFLQDGTDIVLNGRLIEINDLETFKRLKKEAEKAYKKLKN
jgi:hypothetical protein